jgi:hypothetical protein
MERVFLSMTFGAQEDQDLVGFASTMIESQDIRVVTGKNLGGGSLSNEIKRRIEESDALVALCTRHDKLPNGKFTTSQWVRDELLYAASLKKPTMALVEDEVDVAGMLQEHERAHFERANPVAGFGKLATTLALWRQSAGLLLKAAIVRTAIALQLSQKQVGAVE